MTVGTQTVVQFFHQHDIETCEIEERRIEPFFQTKIHNGHVPTFTPGTKLKVNPPKGRIRTWDHSNYDRYMGQLYVHSATYENVAYEGEESDEFPRLTELLIKVTVGKTPPVDTVSFLSEWTPAMQERMEQWVDEHLKGVKSVVDYAKQDGYTTSKMDDNYRKQSEAAARSGPGLFDAILKSAQAEFGEENVTLLDDEILVAGHRAVDLLRLKGFLKSHLKQSPLKDIPLTKEQATALADQFKKTYPELDEWKLRSSEKGPSGIYHAVLDYMEQIVEPDTNPHTRRQELEYQLVTLIEERGMVDGPAALAEKYGPYTLLAYLFTWEMEGMEWSYGEVEQQNSEWAKRVTKAETKHHELIQYMQYQLQPTLVRLTRLLGKDDVDVAEVKQQFEQLAQNNVPVLHSNHDVPDMPELEEFRHKVRDYTDGSLFLTMREEAVKAVAALADARIDLSAQAHRRWQVCGEEASRRLIGTHKLDNWHGDLYFGPHVNVEDATTQEFQEKVQIVHTDVLLFSFLSGWSIEFDKASMAMSLISPAKEAEPVFTATMALALVAHTLRAHISNPLVLQFFGAVPPFTGSLSTVNMSVMLQSHGDWKFDDASDRLLMRSGKYVPMGSYWQFKMD